MRRYYPHDKQSIIQLIDSIYQEYGDTIYLQNADSDLLDIEKNYLLNGEFWVKTKQNDENTVIGCIAVKRETACHNTAVLKRFYLLPEYRGSGLAQQMHDIACPNHMRYIVAPPPLRGGVGVGFFCTSLE